jgi:hypothetical protein
VINYQENGSDTVEEADESTQEKILNFEGLVDDKEDKLDVNKQLPYDHEVICKIPILIELHIDESRKLLGQVLNALPWLQSSPKAQSVQYEYSGNTKDDIFLLLWVWLACDLPGAY